MNFKSLLLFSSFVWIISCTSKKLVIPEMQKDANGLYYKSIPDYPSKYDAESTAARMIDGLGFRFYWATEGLTTKDLIFKPSNEARSSEETIDHIMGLAIIIKNAVNNKENIRSGEESSPLGFNEKRKITLDYLKEASDKLKSGTVKLENLSVIFVSSDNKKSSYPFWNVINGPVADAIWHVGQIVSFRRSSGNPFNGKVNVFSGKVRE